MSELQVEQFTCRSDNFGVLLHDPETQLTAAIDAPEEQAIQGKLIEKGWQLSHIFVTHKHEDHIEGIDGLIKKYHPKIIGSNLTKPFVPQITMTVEDSNIISWAGRDIKVLATPGHTLDHTSYWFSDDNLVFAADCLFALGCGRIFEGDAEMMWRSLEKLAALPDKTAVYCGHEYTLSNARFALQADPKNTDLLRRAEEVARLRQAEQPTLPSTIGLERATNPFLRPDDPSIQQQAGMVGSTALAVFSHLRREKDKS